MRHVILVCILSFVALPLQAQWGLSNVVTKAIHRTPGLPAAPPIVQESPDPEALSVTKQDVRQISYTKATNYPYTIHLSSFETPQEAARQTERLKSKLDMVFVTKIDLGDAGIWYRMDYGAFPTIKDAVLKLQELKGKGIVDKGTFVGGSVPYAIELGMYQTLKDAQSKAQKLAAKGVIPYIIKEREDIYRLLAGAYPNEKSAAPAMNDLMAMNLLPTLKKR